MIADHQWLAAASNLVEHSPGIVSSVVGIVIYALLRDGLPRLRRWRYERNGHTGNPGHNPGNGLAAKRLHECELAIGKLNDFTSRADERWKAQGEHNKRMEKHIEKIYERIDKVAGG